ncbi:hypothetical protein CEXT_596341 [Caerostris extrusa]|uniref:Uncharacterized protein n=1 Tax=Caerostris extrusa TaxID=172846 RepID=A0AAV4TF07_CAEEX|nr:hypothetical protein CEXT_596341 [Caerostris extrusa]
MWGCQDYECPDVRIGGMAATDKGAPFHCQRALPEIYNRPQNFYNRPNGAEQNRYLGFRPKVQGRPRKGLGRPNRRDSIAGSSCLSQCLRFAGLKGIL